MTGRPSSYTNEIADRICEWLADGNSLRTFCLRDDTPSYATVQNWLVNNEAFREKYRIARETQAHNDADRMNEIIAKVESGEVKPDQGRVMMDGLKWTAGRRLPKVYGDKLAVGGDTDSAPIVISWAQGQEK